ncbi:thermonuclease family protein [Celeribacter sp. ULVN23_4]
MALFPVDTAQAASERKPANASGVQPSQSLAVAVAKPGQGVTSISSPADGVLRIVDGDTVAIGEIRIRLFGIDAPELSQSCSDTRGKDWSCGTWSKSVLANLAAGKVRCFARDTDRYGRTVAVCEAGGKDLNAQMVALGAAYAYEEYSSDYVALEQTARADGLGLWRSGSQNPADYRAEKKAEQAAHALPDTPPGDCVIKGNISKSGKLYHLPGGRWYDDTRINEGQGERWFCTEPEAREAGWRKAQG